MLEIRPICENCGKDLANESKFAMICSFECTFCSDCVANILFNVCPNCGGGFEKRPHRPKEALLKYPQNPERYFRPINLNKFKITFLKNNNIDPSER
ncbi:MAG: DUF1272 domain-containing protein [Saprospiraceae bacterium]|nr:DUF1272 domain-containing protein [Saprospiraceae bacterium]MBK9721818.1 DUF1272 domain-containing protein [Saprospiraceae bacterium]